MFSSLFGSKQESLSESDHDLTESYFKNCIYKDQYVSFYQTDARDFVNDIYNSKYQRNTDPEHIKKLAEEIKISKHCVGTFKAVVLHGELKLIDGQHRIMAIRENMENDSTFNINIILEVYYLKDEHEEAEWFRRANNVKNVELEELPRFHIDDVVFKTIELLKEKFKNTFVDVEITKKTSIYRPRIDIQKFKNALKKYIENNPIKVEELYERIIILNNLAGIEKRKHFTSIDKTITQNMWDKAKTSGFYLGLYSNFDWLNKL